VADALWLCVPPIEIREVHRAVDLAAKFEIPVAPAHPVIRMARLVLIVFVLLSAAQSFASELPKLAVLVDPALVKEPLAILLEQQLSVRKDLTVVERSKLGRVTDEAALQRLTGDDRQQRVQILQGLQLADAIVVLRPADKLIMQVVVCDTRRGLRLLRLTLAIAEAPEPQSEALAKEIARQLPMLTNDKLQIWAVPPLISRNLTAEHDHLKSGLARLIEESLRSRGDVLCVELSEAQSLADEIALGRPDLARELPYYVLGEFRHASRQVDATASLTLELKRGGQSLNTIALENLTPDQLGSAITESCAAMIRKTGGEPPRVSDPVAEAKLLAGRAATFSLINNNEEPIPLIESAILLQPQDVKLRHDALMYYRRIIESLVFRSMDGRGRRVAEKTGQDMLRVVPLYVRSLDHLCFSYACALEGKRDYKVLSTLAQHSADPWYRWVGNVDRLPQVQEAVEKIVAAERELLTPLVVREAATEKEVRLIGGRYGFWRMSNEDPDAGVARFLSVVRQLPDEARIREPV